MVPAWRNRRPHRRGRRLAHRPHRLGLVCQAHRLAASARSDVHFLERFGGGRSFLPPQEATHSLTSACGTPSPRSSEAMAFRMPATCHSFTLTYSASASAARNDRLRPVLLASFSNRF